MGRRHLLITGRTGLGGTGSPAEGVVGTSCKAHGEPSSSNNRAHRPGGDGESTPGGGRSLLPGPMGGHLLQRTGRTGPGGTGSPAQGVFGVSCQGNGGPSSLENRAHRLGGDGESCPGGGRSLLPGPMGGHLLQRTGRTGPGGTGSPAQGVFGVSCEAKGGPSSPENRAHRPGGDGESCPGGVRSLLPGQWGAIFFREPGAPARGGRGVLPRGCSDPPARAMGGHLLQRTGRTGPGGTGSPAQGVFGVSCKASGGPSSSVGSGTPAMHCPTAWGQWTVQLLQCTASLSQSSGQWNSCNALPHCPGAVGSGTLAMHCLTASGQRTVQPLQCTASLPWVSGQCNSCNAPPHCPGGSGQRNSCNALPHCLGAVGSATPAIHCRTAGGQWAAQLLQRTAALAWGQWAVDLRQYTAALPGGSEQCSSCITRPHCLGAVDSATPALHCLTVWGQWAAELMQRTASLPGGNGQWNSCNALPHCLGVLGSATSAIHCRTAWGQWAAQLLQCTASLPWGSGQRNSCNALPHCLGAVGSAPPAMHCLTAWGQWAVQLLQWVVGV